MAANSQTAFSLRPWPTGDKKPQNLAEFISRVNAQPGGFRNLNEAKLRQEIQAGQQGRIEEDDAANSSEEEEDDDDAEEVKGKTAAVAREEFLRNIDFAHQSAMLALDSISLLLSKENPVQAGTTLSPALRDLVGIGTLGASKLKEPNVTEALIQNDLSVATGWRIMGINSMVDSVLAAAERLEKEIELETKYWADVLAVSDDGWTVCALPHESYTLGVRFGFSESASDFRNGSIAPLIRNDDGSIKLGVGRLGGGSQRIQITVKKNGTITDQSPLPWRIPEDAPLNTRVREARDTIFHQELWYELNREARVMLAYDVYYRGQAITWKQNKETEFIITLEDLHEQDGTNANAGSNDGTRSSIMAYSFLQFLLFQSHRQNYHRRTSPSPSVRQTDPNNSTYNILRSLVSRFEYFQNSAEFGNQLEKLVRTLQHAGMPSASYSTLPPPNSSASGVIQARHTLTTELRWVHQLVFNLVSLYTFDITSDIRIWCSSRGIMRPFIGTYFIMSLRDPSVDSKNLPPSWLETVYPPADYCANVQEAVYYLCQGTVRVLSHKLAQTAADKLPDNEIQWSETISGIGIKSAKGRNAEISVDVVDDEMRLSLSAKWHDGNTSRSHTWTWTSDDPNAGGESIENVVLKLMGGTL
ncbi:subunit 17 of mediator complex-domain-containing protein [Nemania sp. NC0429]|nr:subunit 17 of mediator complex-domain-containing protein [Nemania sp. NC0429]